MKREHKKILLFLASVYWVLALLIFGIAHEQFDHAVAESDSLSPSMTTGELCDGHSLSQNLTAPADSVTAISLMAIPSTESEGLLRMEIADSTGKSLTAVEIPVRDLAPSAYSRIPLDQPLEGFRGESLCVSISTEGCRQGEGVLLYFGDSIAAGKFNIIRKIEAHEAFTQDGMPGRGMLCLRLSGQSHLGLQGVYWAVVLALFALAAATVAVGVCRTSKGKPSRLIYALEASTQYRFLIKQLVNRDFMTKYKRSVLGVFWSFLNPLLTMAVQYVVFSTLFRSDTPYYAVYLLTGLVFFGFFSEACNLGINAIIGNASLIKKVYMPKYIYPLTRVLSSLINLVISLIPLFAVALLSGLRPRLSILLLSFDIICLLMFVAGMVLILCTMMTFFQDTHFLWGLVSMMWMYMTPIFYPETIIPAKFLPIYRMNPLYQYISFARSCIIDGVSPAPATYLWCLLSAAAVLVIGLVVFKRNQDKFILHI